MKKSLNGFDLDVMANDLRKQELKTVGQACVLMQTVLDSAITLTKHQADERVVAIDDGYVRFRPFYREGVLMRALSSFISNKVC